MLTDIKVIFQINPTHSYAPFYLASFLDFFLLILSLYKSGFLRCTHSNIILIYDSAMSLGVDIHKRKDSISIQTEKITYVNTYKTKNELLHLKVASLAQKNIKYLSQ